MITRHMTALLLGGVVSLQCTGCLSTPPPPAPVDAERAAVTLTTPKGVVAHGQPLTDQDEALDLQQVLALAASHNPTLSAYANQVGIAEAASRQSRLLPNPTLTVEVEEYDRNGVGFDSAEVVIALKQSVSVGQKRRWRVRAADAQGALAVLDYETKRQEVLMRTAQHCIAVMAAQRHLDLARSSVELAEKSYHAVVARVKAGKETPLQSAKADAELELARIRALDAESRLTVCRLRLAGMWGDDAAQFARVSGVFEMVPMAIPALPVLRDALAETPAMMRWNLKEKQRFAELKAAKANRLESPTASVAFQHYQEDDSDAIAFGLQLPLPLFNRNQGNIAAATQELEQAKAERVAAELRLASELSEAYADLSSAHRRTHVIQTRIIPVIQGASDAALEGYRQGKFGFMDVLDAQRGVFDVKGSYVDSLSQYHQAWATIQKLTARYEAWPTNTQQEKQ